MKKVLVAVLALALSFNASAEDYMSFVKKDNILGKVTAPVTFIEYASLTCSHCANFSRDTVSRIKKEYVETGKVAFAFRPLPFEGDHLSMAVSKVIACAPKGQYYNFLAAFFKSQRQWIMSKDQMSAITSIAQLGGMSGVDVQKCILNPKIQSDIVEFRNSAANLGIDSTPSFIINGELYSGNLGYERVKAIIESELAK